MEVICQSYSFFSCHQAESIINRIVLFLNEAKSSATEHPPPVVLWEDCVPPNVLETMVF